jgi:predicted transcriptional regulator
MPIQKLETKNCVAADSEIDSRTVSLSISKLTVKNYVTTDLEIDNQKPCCRFRNRQSKTVVDSKISSRTVSLPIQKLATKNSVAVDLEIGSNDGVIFGFNLLFLGVHILPS